MSYVEDIRALKRCKAEASANWLVWRKGKFSENEIQSIKSGLESWVEEMMTDRKCHREEALELLKWAKENKLTAWCEIATRCSLPDRKIGAIRHCILRRMMPGTEQRRRWTKAETVEFARLQEAYGPRAWKQISQETGRTMEEVANKGRQMEQSAKYKDPATPKFVTDHTLRVNLTKLVKEGDEASPYEFSAIRADCKLVALVRRYTCPSGEYTTIHEIPSAKIGEKLGTTNVATRLRWHQNILPSVVNRVTIKLADSEMMDKYLLLRLRRACLGKIVDTDGLQVFPCYDWEGVDWKNLMPLWPQAVTEGRLRPLLKRQQKFGIAPLLEVVEAAVTDILPERKSVNHTANLHFEELRKVLNAIADRGQAFFEEDKHAIVLE